jgi:predicted ester cyclase
MTASSRASPRPGKQATFELIDINRFDASGKVVEHWPLVDMLGLLQQLGAVPARS